MDFTDMVTEVQGLVKRPDKAAAIGSAINSALSQYVFRTEFTHDLVETTIPVDANEYSQTIDLTTLDPALIRFRKWKYIKPYGVRGYILPIDPQNVFVPGGSIQTDRYYMIGSKLTIITSALASSLSVGYFQHAPVLSGSNTFWLTDLCPYAVINRAAGEIFNAIGDPKSGSFHLALAEQLYTTLANDCRDQITY